MCDGWSVADVVLHLAQTNEMASAGHRHVSGRHAPPPLPAAGSIDDGADALVRPHRDARRRPTIGCAVAQVRPTLCSRCAPANPTLGSSGWPHARRSHAGDHLLAETWIHTVASAVRSLP